MNLVAQYYGYPTLEKLEDGRSAVVSLRQVFVYARDHGTLEPFKDALHNFLDDNPEVCSVTFDGVTFTGEKEPPVPLDSWGPNRPHQRGD